MALIDQVREDLKQAMLSKDELRVSTIRMLLSAVKNTEIAKGHSLSDEEILAVVQKEVKQRKDSIEGFKAGGRQDLVAKETQETEILQGYLPEQLTEEEVRRIVEETVQETKATGINQMGMVMGTVMAKVGGKAAGDVVSKIVKEKLTP
ncbi:MAG: GatB/YqeY domain-containing protein [Patescibacteria group bacterium]|nr:GatB/YqeY domain-containing protein [Patescibacteria group bacterium]